MYDAIFQFLQASSITQNPQITDLKIYGQNTFRVKIRATVASTLTFQVWINHNSARTRCAYQLFSQDDTLLRWDNAPHYPHLQTNFPHHFHDDQGQVTASDLQGVPLQDLPIILAEIERYVATLLSSRTASSP